MGGERHVFFTTHVKLNTMTEFNELLTVKNQIKKILKKYPFEHYTIETEMDNEKCGLEND
jgi:cobalt-zinc-cadmium efflux system protein